MPRNMYRFKNSFFYMSVIGGFSAMMYLTVFVGVNLEEGRNIVIPQNGRSQWQNFLDSLIHNVEHPLAILLAQIVTIIFVARFFGWICKKIGQPTVIGEIIAGVVLCPSLI